jgi:hypothetical protein
MRSLWIRALYRLSIPGEFDTYHLHACNDRDGQLFPVLGYMALGDLLPSI